METNKNEKGEISRSKLEEERQEMLLNAKKVRGSLSAYMNWPVWVSIAILVLCIAVTAIDWVAGGVASGVGIIIIIGIMSLSAYYYRRVSSDMVAFGAGYAQIQKQLLRDMKVPYAIADEKYNLIWMNQAFCEELGVESKSHRNLTSFFPEIQEQCFNTDASVTIHSCCQNRKYEITMQSVSLDDIMANMVNEEENSRISSQMYAVYLHDETEILRCKQELEDEKQVAALIYIDNYDEAIESIEEVRRSMLVAMVDRRISKYISNHHGVISRLENDKYFAVFTMHHLREMMEKQFSIIDEVRKLNIGNKTAVTISIGLGVNGGSYSKNYEYARAAMDMALGRGGDQAVLKDKGNIRYYGGKAQNQGKNTRVRARVKAQALKELIDSAGNVLIMGHRISDADCIGAAVGIHNAAHSSDKRAWIVLDHISNNIEPLIELFEKNPEYKKDLFIDSETAMSYVQEDTLLVVVDNNRASYSECPGLFKFVKKVVVIDHHRQATDHIENTLLSYVEPYASSASEMVAEILQYYSENIKIKPEEAEAMYSGIVIDTNNFLDKTGVRTFEAAAFLRRNGADVTRVRKLFRDEMDDYKTRAETIRDAEIFMGCYAISICPSGICSSPTVAAAQAANELLGIRNIKASFVLTDYEGAIYISARSIDEINVQVIMEKLGGGGHLSVAGAQLKNVSVREARAQLKDILLRGSVPAPKG